MKLVAVKNIQFSKLIKINGKLKEFNFRKPNRNDDSNFTVDVLDERGDRIIFHMEKSEGKWVIVQGELPDWIAGKEDALNDVIINDLDL
ncbi:MAG: hypothetical protein JSR00_10450 [Bacteroidetes bacterium]|nr:hypothetical protein [Bacteroidota bacterium]